MPPVKSLKQSSEKWARQSATATPEYKFGIENPRTDWAKATMDAENNYKAGVTKAANEGRFGKGVAKAGTSKWRENALSKGVSRWSQGISLSEDNYQRGFAPFRETLVNLQLSPRGPKGDPANINRVAEVAQALHKKKLELKSA
jgi:hypothetical protein